MQYLVERFGTHSIDIRYLSPYRSHSVHPNPYRDRHFFNPAILRITMSSKAPIAAHRPFTLKNEDSSPITKSSTNTMANTMRALENIPMKFLIADLQLLFFQFIIIFSFPLICNILLILYTKKSKIEWYLNQKGGLSNEYFQQVPAEEKEAGTDSK